MKKVNPKKLIPTSPIGDTSSVSPNILIPASNVTTKSYARVDDDIDTPQQQELKQQTIVLKTKFIELEKLFGEKTKLEKDKNRRKRLNDERKKREKNENLKESQKTKFNFGNKLPRLELPRTGFLDTIKRFLLYGLLGFAIDKLGPAIPGLLKLGSKILPAIQFFGNLVGNIANNVIGFIDTGYKVFDFVKSQVSDIVGPEISSEFGKFSGVLNSALNTALVVGTAVLGAGAASKLSKKIGTASGLGLTGLLGLSALRRRNLLLKLKQGRDRELSRRGTAKDELTRRRFELRSRRELLIQKSVAESIDEDIGDEKVRMQVEDLKKESQLRSIKSIEKGKPVYNEKLGKKTVELAIPTLGRKRFSPAVADTLEYMAKTYGIKNNLELISAFEDPDFYGENISKYRRERNRLKGIKITTRNRLSPSEAISRTPKEISGLKGASKVKGLFGKLAGPLIGGVVDFFISLLSGDPPGLAIATAIGAGLGTAIGAAIGTAVLPVAGSFIGGVAGGFVGSSLLEMLYNRIIGKRQESGDLSKDVSTSTSATRKVAPAKPITLSEEDRKNYNVTPIITSRFGATESFRGGKPHGGSDIAVPVGTPLVAVSNGKIIETKYESGWGNYIVYTDIKGMYHLYGHLQSIRRTSGLVSRGEIIGYSGATGRVTGPHLHWELGSGWNGKITGKVDPLNMWNLYAPFATKSQSKASANLKQSSSNIAAGLQDQAGYEQSGYNIALLPIIDEIEKVVPVPMGGGGATIVNSSTPSIFAPALIG